MKRADKRAKDPYGRNENSMDPFSMDRIFFESDKWWPYLNNYELSKKKDKFMKLVKEKIFKIEDDGKGNKMYISNIFKVFKELLTEKQYKIFELKYRCKKTHAQIAEELGISHVMVSKSLKSSKLRLRKKLYNLKNMM